MSFRKFLEYFIENDRFPLFKIKVGHATYTLA